MPTPNVSCKVCGTPYHVCKSCEESTVFMWRQVCCSLECATVWFKRIAESRGETIEKREEVGKLYSIRAFINRTDNVHDIKSYEVSGGKLCKLVSTFKDTEYTFEDVDYFIIPRDEMARILSASAGNVNTNPSPYPKRGRGKATEG